MAAHHRGLTPELAQRRARVVELRSKRWTFAEIGRELSVTEQRAWQLYRATLAAAPMKSVDEHRHEAGTLADAAVKNLLTIATDVKAGLRSRIDAWSVIRSWEEHRAKLYGTNAPVRTEVLTISSIDQQIVELELELRTSNG
jgi:hypothetical protein